MSKVIRLNINVCLNIIWGINSRESMYWAISKMKEQNLIVCVGGEMKMVSWLYWKKYFIYNQSCILKKKNPLNSIKNIVFVINKLLERMYKNMVANTITLTYTSTHTYKPTHPYTPLLPPTPTLTQTPRTTTPLPTFTHPHPITHPQRSHTSIYYLQ